MQDGLHLGESLGKKKKIVRRNDIKSILKEKDSLTMICWKKIDEIIILTIINIYWVCTICYGSLHVIMH